MKLKKFDVSSILVDRVIFFTEDSMEDFCFSHVLCVVPDLPIPEDIVRFNKYRMMPNKVIASDRFGATKVLGGM